MSQWMLAVCAATLKMWFRLVAAVWRDVVGDPAIALSEEFARDHFAPAQNATQAYVPDPKASDVSPKQERSQ